jgi:hypothetical protein
MHDNNDPIHSLVHLYVDGAFGFREMFKRVTARAGFVAISFGLPSRQGGFQAFPDPAHQTVAYNRTSSTNW